MVRQLAYVGWLVSPPLFFLALLWHYVPARDLKSKHATQLYTLLFQAPGAEGEV
jgi:hypothetical protein